MARVAFFHQLPHQEEQSSGPRLATADEIKSYVREHNAAWKAGRALKSKKKALKDG